MDKNTRLALGFLVIVILVFVLFFVTTIYRAKHPEKTAQTHGHVLVKPNDNTL